MTALPALLSLALLSSNGAKELDALCKSAKELVGRKPASFKPERGADWYDTRWVEWRTKADQTVKDKELETTLDASAHVSPTDKIPVFEFYAKNIGQPSWSCPALETLLLPPDKDLAGLCDDAKHGPVTDPPIGSRAVKAAWKTAQEKKGAAGFQVLWAAAEWPEKAFEDCDDLKEFLNGLASHAARGAQASNDEGGRTVSIEGSVEGDRAEMGGIAFFKQLQQSVFALGSCATSQSAAPGSTAVELKVSGGKVQKALLTGGPGPAAFDACVVKAMKGWPFPKSKAPAKVTFRIKVD